LKIPCFLEGRARGKSEHKCQCCGVKKKLRMFRLLKEGHSGAPRSGVCIECEDEHWRKAYRYAE
jgi:hypothetical protein